MQSQKTRKHRHQKQVNFMPTAHYTTRHDKTTPVKKIVKCAGVYDTTRHKSGLVVSDLTMLDICDKARFFVLCRVVS